MTPKAKAEEHLKQATVKIDTPYSEGSGFFIDKNLVVTCYHVIKGAKAKEITIIWQGVSYKATNIEVNEKDDLATVSVKIDKKHPTLKLDTTIETGDECYSFGFPTENEKFRHSGDTLTFKSEGDNGELLKFKDGHFQSGFSGSPILNYKTLRVCGIIKGTRDNYSNLGGRGIPISKLIDFLKSKNYDIDDNGSIFSKEMFKNWVWTSSVESADRLQFSVLALVETLAAVSVSLYLWIFQKEYYHIVIGLIVAPLFLLRTHKIELEAIKYFTNFMEGINFSELKELTLGIARKIISFIDYVVSFIFTDTGNIQLNILKWALLAFPAIEICDTLGCNMDLLTYSDSRAYMALVIALYAILGVIMLYSISPFITLVGVTFSMILISIIAFTVKVIVIINNLPNIKLRNIPKNWYKIILSIDSFHFPELLPGIEKTNSNFRFSYFYKVNIINNQNILFKSIFFLMIAILFIPTIIFRYSLKSTAWIYLPLIWLIEPQDKSDLTTRMKIESKNFIAYLMFFYSLIVVFVFTLIPLVFPYTDIGVYLQTLHLPETLKKIFFAYEFNIWHLTRFLSALITIIFMVSFTKILIKRETNPSYGNFWGAKLLSLRVVRTILTLITLGFTAYHILQLLPSDFWSNLWKNLFNNLY